MPVIAFATTKGGSGKSTATLITAGEILDAGSTVTIIDADPNQPLVEWSEATGPKDGLNVIGDVNEESIVEIIEDAATKTTFVLVDLEGSANLLVSYAISRSDLVIVPCQGSHLDGQGAAATIQMVATIAKNFKTEIKASVLLSRTSAAMQPRSLKQIVQMFKDASVDVFNVQLIDRAAYKSIFSYGGTIHDLQNSEVSNLVGAKENAAALIEEIIARLNPDSVKAEGVAA